MPPKQNNNKGDIVECLYIENLWCVNSNGTLYVRTVTPQSMRASSSSDFSIHRPLRRLGTIETISFTKSLKTTNANHKFCFKIRTDCVNSQGGQQTKVWGLLEANYSDFHFDKDISEYTKSNDKEWISHKAIEASLREAMIKKGLKKSGEWLKKVFKSDVLPHTHHDDVTSIRSSPIPVVSEQVFDSSAAPALNFDTTNDTQEDGGLSADGALSPILVEPPTGIHICMYNVHMYMCLLHCLHSLVYIYKN